MPIELTCSCGKRLRVADDLAGKQGQCPFCGELLPIPEVADADKAIQAVSDPESKNNAQLTPVGCILALLTVAVICVVAIPIMRWRDPNSGQSLPHDVAIAAPVLIGAVVYGIGTLLLRLLGVRVWAKREKDAEK